MARCFAFFTLFHLSLTYFLTGLALQCTYFYIFKKVILNGWDFKNFCEAQVKKCGQNLKNAQSALGLGKFFF